MCLSRMERSNAFHGGCRDGSYCLSLPTTLDLFHNVYMGIFTALVLHSFHTAVDMVQITATGGRGHSEANSGRTWCNAHPPLICPNLAHAAAFVRNDVPNLESKHTHLPNWWASLQTIILPTHLLINQRRMQPHSCFTAGNRFVCTVALS